MALKLYSGQPSVSDAAYMVAAVVGLIGFENCVPNGKYHPSYKDGLNAVIAAYNHENPDKIQLSFLK